ncbi:MAG: alpha/beta hydrolase [Caldilineales bacterium]|nr:alpha/beta hydrolase [Caldilineales bacterium]MDW8318076.1 alpha/beta hydrolase [Anaerolineae bacterium]
MLRDVYVNRIRLYYEVAGDGHPLLMIPEAGFSHWMWHKVAPALAERYQVFLPDPRGTGQTDKGREPLSVELLAGDMIGLLDELHCRGAFVVGHGLGAYVAMQVALDRPDLVSKLVLAAADPGDPKAVPPTAEVAELLERGVPTNLDGVERMITLFTAPSFPQRLPQVVREILAYHMSEDVPAEHFDAQLEAKEAARSRGFGDRLAEITAPTLVLAGEQDRVTPVGNARLLASLLPKAQVVTLPNTGHLFPLEDPEATVKALVGFLGGRKYLPSAGGMLARAKV